MPQSATEWPKVFQVGADQPRSLLSEICRLILAVTWPRTESAQVVSAVCIWATSRLIETLLGDKRTPLEDIYIERSPEGFWFPRFSLG